MKITACRIMFLSAVLLACAETGAQTLKVKAIGEVVTPDPKAVAVATRWLAIADAHKYRQAYGEMAARVQAGGEVVTEQWVGKMKERHSALGRPISRTLFRARFSKTLAGAPDGTYEFLDYRTVFEHKRQTFETVTLTKESGHWQVSGYHFM